MKKQGYYPGMYIKLSAGYLEQALQEKRKRKERFAMLVANEINKKLQEATK